MALKDDMKYAIRNYRAPYGLEELELRQEGRKAGCGRTPVCIPHRV